MTIWPRTIWTCEVMDHDIFDQCISAQDKLDQRTIWLKTLWTRRQFGSWHFGPKWDLAISKVWPFKGHYCGSTQTYTQLFFFLRCRNIRLIWLAIIQCACTYIRRTLFGLPAVPIISKGHGGGSGSARMDWVFLTSVSNVILPGQEAKLVKSGCAKPMKLNRRHYERKLTVITLIF